MGALDWMEWFGLKAYPEAHREATDCPCLPCRRRKAHRAGWTAVGTAFHTIAHWKFLRWRVERDRADWPSLTTRHLEGIDNNK